MKTTELQDAILIEFLKSRPLAITNYSYLTGYEADIIMISPSGLATEVEVKTSRADFKKDFSKTTKHKHLKAPTVSKGTSTVAKYPKAPNYFYYACEEGLLTVKDIPPYAGLIHVKKNGEVIAVKKSPKLHSFKVPEYMRHNIGRVLSIRTVLGSSYLRYKHGHRD